MGKTKKRVLGLKITAPEHIENNGKINCVHPVVAWALVDEVDNDSERGIVENISDNDIFNIARKKIGQYLLEVINIKDIKIDDVLIATGFSNEKLRSIIEGNYEYTIDDFLNICRALDCKFYMEDK